MSDSNPFQGEVTLSDISPSMDWAGAETIEDHLSELDLGEDDKNAIRRWLTRIHNEKSENTLDSYQYDLLGFARWLDGKEFDVVMVEMNPNGIKRYIEQMTVSYSSKSGKYYTLKGFYDFLEENYADVKQTPFEDLKHEDIVGKKEETKQDKHIKDNQNKYVSEEEKEKLKANAPKPKTRNKCIIELMWQTGMRSSEIVNLKVNDIDDEKRKISFYSTKTDDTRSTWYQPTLDRYLHDWESQRKAYGGFHTDEDSGSEYYFVSHVRESLQPSRINKIIKQAAENAGIQGILYQDEHDASKTGLDSVDEDTEWNRYRITAHKLRNGYAVKFLKNGGDIKRLADLMGHENIEQTQEYLDMIDEDIKNAQKENGPR